MGWSHVRRIPLEGHSVHVSDMDPDWYRDTFTHDMPNGIVVGVYDEDATVLMYKTGENKDFPLDAFQRYDGEHPARMWKVDW
jgi:hypothetical protein